jgi:hypothetical protein
MNRGPDELARGLRHAQLVGGALVFAIAMFAYVAEMIRTQQAPFVGFVPTAPLGLLRLVLAAMAVFDLVVVNIVRQKIVAGRAAAGQGAPLAQRLLNASIVALGMCESIAIYGFVLFLLGGQRADFYAFAAFALLGFAIYFPRRSQWEAWARQA